MLFAGQKLEIGNDVNSEVIRTSVFCAAHCNRCMIKYVAWNLTSHMYLQRSVIYKTGHHALQK